jgi:hypothetical protein
MFTLTEENKSFALASWDKMSLTELTQSICNDDNLDGRSLEGRVIREFLISQGKQPKSTTFKKVEPVVLTNEQKQFVESNLTLRPIEIARIIFENPKIEPLGRHVQAVSRYMAEINTSQGIVSEEVLHTDYKPPVQLSQVVKKVNDFARKDFDLSTMSTLQKRNMEALKNFIHSPRFLQMINSYVTQKSRNVFEQEFIRAIYDKPDLNPDELNLYVNLCHNYVMMITLNRHKDMLDERYESVLMDPNSKISQTLSEMIKAKTDELNKCDKRQSELIEALNGKRAQRIKEQKINSASIANLIDWFKDESERQKALAWAEKESLEAEEEIDRLESISEMKARVLGISRSEMMHG